MSGKPTRSKAPVSSPIRTGFTRARRKLRRLTRNDIKRLRGSDLWTIAEAACAQAGYRYDPEVEPSDFPQAVIDAIDVVSRACIGGRLRTIERQDVVLGQRYLDPVEVIRWAAERFPDCPLASMGGAAQPAGKARRQNNLKPAIVEVAKAIEAEGGEVNAVTVPETPNDGRGPQVAVHRQGGLEEGPAMASC